MLIKTEKEKHAGSFCYGLQQLTSLQGMNARFLAKKLISFVNFPFNKSFSRYNEYDLEHELVINPSDHSLSDLQAFFPVGKLNRTNSIYRTECNSCIK